LRQLVLIHEVRLLESISSAAHDAGATFRRLSDGVATSQEGQRSPTSGRAGPSPSPVVTEKSKLSASPGVDANANTYANTPKVILFMTRYSMVTPRKKVYRACILNPMPIALVASNLQANF
jgi:hypothetical protein